MIQNHLYFEDPDGDTMTVEPQDIDGNRLLFTTTTIVNGDIVSASATVGVEEAAHLIAHLGAFLTRFSPCGCDD